MDWQRLITVAGQTGKQAHRRAAKLFALAALMLALAAVLDLLSKHRVSGFMFGALAFMDGSLAFLYHALSQRGSDGDA